MKPIGTVFYIYDVGENHPHWFDMTEFKVTINDHREGGEQNVSSKPFKSFVKVFHFIQNDCDKRGVDFNGIEEVEEGVGFFENGYITLKVPSPTGDIYYVIYKQD